MWAVTRTYIAGRAVPVRASIVAVCGKSNNNSMTMLLGDVPRWHGAAIDPGISRPTLLGFTVNEAWASGLLGSRAHPRRGGNAGGRLSSLCRRVARVTPLPTGMMGPERAGRVNMKECGKTEWLINGRCGRLSTLEWEEGSNDDRKEGRRWMWRRNGHLVENYTLQLYK